jgi:hypothetical protein
MAVESAKFDPKGSIIAVIDGTTFTIPDDFGNRHRHMIEEWVNEGNTIEEYVPPPVDLNAYVANLRYEKEIGGTVWNTYPVHTDRESQNKISAEVLAISLGLRQDGDPWKFKDGEFRPITNAQMTDIANTVRSHIRNVFGKESLVIDKINSKEITTTDQIDIIFNE